MLTHLGLADEASSAQDGTPMPTLGLIYPGLYAPSGVDAMGVLVSQLESVPLSITHQALSAA